LPPAGKHLRLEHHRPANVIGDAAGVLRLLGGAALRQAHTLLAE
jgi:hypothetical protein